MSDTKEQPLLLKDLIRQVRNELTEAVNARKRNNEPGMFAVKSLTLEVNFVIENEETLDGGAKASLMAISFKAGGEKKYKTEQVHKITLELTPSSSQPDIDPFMLLRADSQGTPVVTKLDDGGMLLSNPHKIEDFSGMSAELKTAIKKMNWSPLQKHADSYSVIIPKSSGKKK